MNVTNLIINLRSKITANTIDQQMVSKAIKLLKLNAVQSVPLFTLLPSPTENTGEIYYVEFDGLYWSTGISWLPMVTTSETKIWAWGDNSSGQHGTNNTTNTSSPVSTVGVFGDWCQIAIGDSHSVALRPNGTLWAWGSNGFGRLGDNTSTDRSSPVSVVGAFTNWCQVGTSTFNTTAIRTNGTIWTWGSNCCGQLGNNTAGIGTSVSSPVSVVGGFTDWCCISSGFGQYFTVALRTNGTAWAWGMNNEGRLGDNTTTPKSSPVSVVGGFTDWSQISSGRSFTLGLRSNGTIWGWGRGFAGQLGNGSGADRSSPVSVVGGFTDWCQVSAGTYIAAAIRTNGTLWSWGCNTNGAVGDGTVTSRLSPVSVVGGFTDWCRVSAGGGHSIGIRTNNSLWAWGDNSSGQLGNNSTTNRSSPVSVVGGITNWNQIIAGGSRNVVTRRTTL